MLPNTITSQFSKELTRQLTALRHDLHQHPELSFNETRTSQQLMDALRQLKPKELKIIAGTGIAARIQGRRADAPIVAIRGDIDALPIQERTGQPFQSVHDGIMHACGHDIHATWAYAAACLLTTSPADGDVVIIFQPAEEIGKGALAVLESGVLDNVQAIFGGHVDNNFELGQVVVQTGAISASSDRFTLSIHGKSSHGARPQEGHDPIAALGALIQSINTIISRDIDPANAAVLSIGSVQAGSTHNIIPEQCDITGTIRALDTDIRLHIYERLHAISKGIGDSYNCHIQSI